MVLQVTVRFLDYGNVEEIPLHLVTKLPVEFKEYPFQVKTIAITEDNSYSLG